MSCNIQQIVHKKLLLKSNIAVFETYKTKNQMFLENFSLNGA